jgi:hypothetical protein
MVYALTATLPRGVLAQETEAALDRPIVKRCENWGDACRLLGDRRTLWDVAIGAAVGRFPAYAQSRSQQWDAPSPNPRLALNIDDAKLVDHAACALPIYPHALLASWYAHRLNPSICLTNAAKKAGMKRAPWRLFDEHLEQAHDALIAALALPAVIRRNRARDIARAMLSAEIAQDVIA